MIIYKAIIKNIAYNYVFKTVCIHCLNKKGVQNP